MWHFKTFAAYMIYSLLERVGYHRHRSFINSLFGLDGASSAVTNESLSQVADLRFLQRVIIADPQRYLPGDYRYQWDGGGSKSAALRPALDVYTIRQQCDFFQTGESSASRIPDFSASIERQNPGLSFLLVFIKILSTDNPTYTLRNRDLSGWTSAEVLMPGPISAKAGNYPLLSSSELERSSRVAPN
ncbi:hypothetical protein Hypma_013886 [Hypsizygus marmoreus]|uniref:Uncharacterized protein n=1 Tax=Hypsizygus marmoreus TaxID=39966 RepID=A0A369K908_HYPMA|nr:hypothetical protein Hypma_013886 [Hypsizygus marmoreus]